MIQRKQSIFLILSVLFYCLTFSFPFATIGDYRLTNFQSSIDEVIARIENYYFSLPLLLAATLTAVTIFLYQKRQYQLVVLRITLLLFLVSICLLALYIRSAQRNLPEYNFQIGASFFVPFLCFFLNLLAMRAIKQDERLVRSVDRIR